ncbi:MAG: tetratricopeptide repeat protein, partial [Chloroflexota bacterium]
MRKSGLLSAGLAVWAAVCGLGLGAGEPPPGVEKPSGADDPPWDAQPTFEQLYDRYLPGFSYVGSDERGKPPKYSKQPGFLNLAEVDMDAQVWPIIKKANEVAWAKKEPRRATELYRQILESFPDDQVQIAGEGIFIPASLYVQRQILRYPVKELNYYRILYDPPAKEIYERALRRYSIPDYKDLVKLHLATSYGDDALFALGNAALDNGRFNEARRYYEQLVAYHGQVDEDKDDIVLDRDQVWVRLAICYKHLDRGGEYQAVLGKLKNRSESTVANLLTQLAAFKYDEYEVRQRECRLSPHYDVMEDRCISQPMPYPWTANKGQWEANLSPRAWHLEPEAKPWVTETDMIYKDYNVLYSRSILTGELNWVFGPGGSSQDWDYYIRYPYIYT